MGGSSAHFLRGPRPIAVVQVVAEEILVVGVVPRFVLVGRLVALGFLGSAATSAGWRSSVGTSSSIGFSTISWFKKIGELQRRHRQQLDGLLQRWREDELLNELGVESLLDTH